MLTPLRICSQCQGKGWITRNDWPTECEVCTPTKTVKGRVVLDAKRQAALLSPPKQPSIPVYTPSKAKYQGAGTTSYDWD